MQATAIKTPQTELTETQSQTYIRNMIRAGFSSILYLRGIFDETHFIDRTLCGVNIKALVPHDGNAITFTQWIESGVFDALQKKYLKSIILSLYEDAQNDRSLLESYHFSIAYTEANGVSIDVEHFSGSKNRCSKSNQAPSVPKWPSKDQIKEATVALLRRLIVLTQTLDPLPQKRDLVMRLTYYSDITPQDYTPEFFTTALVPTDKQHDKPEAEELQIGSVMTPFHSLSFSVMSVPAGVQQCRSETSSWTEERPGCMAAQDVFDPNASVYSSEAANETMSDAVEESSGSQASSCMVPSQRMPQASQRSAKIAAGPFRALLANRSFVTTSQLAAHLRQAGMNSSEAMTTMMVKELQSAGFLGQQARGRGTEVALSRFFDAPLCPLSEVGSLGKRVKMVDGLSSG